MLGIGLSLAFVVELIAMIAIADIGLLLPLGLPWRIAAFCVLLAGIIVFWAVFMAPKAPNRLKGLRYTIAKSVIYIVATVVVIIEYGSFMGVLFSLAVLWSESALRSAGGTPGTAAKPKKK